jgi:tripeptide aminopeptidase
MIEFTYELFLGLEALNLIKEERLINNFLNMLNQESPSFKELEMGKWLIEYFNKKNIDVYMDQSAPKIGGNCGNIIAHIGRSGGSNAGKPLCFAAHIDQIPPCCNIKPKIEGNLIKTDGTTTLGGDDKAGIAAILEALEHVLEEGLPHKEIYLLFTVCEEKGLLGSKNLDRSIMPAEDVIIVDAAGPAGILAYKAPAMRTIEVIFKGKKAHAGIEPEKGINAIRIAAEAINLMHIGRIDSETTSNIGRIEGGEATNIVPDEVKIEAEIRSHSMEKLEYETNHMMNCCKISANKYNLEFEFKYDLDYPALELCKDSYVYKLCIKAFEEEGIKSKPMVIGGGSDANILCEKGYNCAIISVGMDKVHTKEEILSIKDMVDTSKVIARMMIED